MEPAPVIRRPKSSQSHQVRPMFDPALSSIQKLPTESSGQAKTGIIGRAAADADETSPCSFAFRCSEHGAQSKCIQFERVKFLRRQHRQADHARRFDDGGPALRLPPPRSRARTMRRVHRSNLLTSGAEQAAHDLAKSFSTVAHRQQSQLVLRPGPDPAVANRFGRRARGQSSFELVGDY